MRPHEAHPGRTVRIGQGTRKTEFRGMGGIIERSFAAAEATDPGAPRDCLVAAS